MPVARCKPELRVLLPPSRVEWTVLMPLSMPSRAPVRVRWTVPVTPVACGCCGDLTVPDLTAAGAFFATGVAAVPCTLVPIGFFVCGRTAGGTGFFFAALVVPALETVGDIFAVVFCAFTAGGIGFFAAPPAAGVLTGVFTGVVPPTTGFFTAGVAGFAGVLTGVAADLTGLLTGVVPGFAVVVVDFAGVFADVKVFAGVFAGVFAAAIGFVVGVGFAGVVFALPVGGGGFFVGGARFG